ncbi:hypothetical protein [Mycobacteroides salmoniphilum]|uniref:hypothetical protein n=1 Tax=Mycobacteroides salmoniphilum TaxID=404941 RepID=UPI0012FF9F6C|nr:hypothetical protein [Mycobacteroides salmoniphilum]
MPSALALAAKIYALGEVDHDAVLAALGLNRDTAAFGIANIKAGQRPGTFTIRTPYMRF